jgi:DNA polymerase
MATLSPAHAPPAAAFERLARDVRSCYTCAEMNHVHVLAASNGPLGARVMFIGEAPGRLGAARTGVPFTSDQSGLRFQRLLAAAGLRREEVFITNALLCNPLRNGANRPPRRRELAACALWLEAQLRLVDAPLVVSLGTAALEALRLIERHPFALSRDAGRALPWRGRTLVPLYHPSPRTAGRRPFAQQLEDFRRLRVLASDAPLYRPTL